MADLYQPNYSTERKSIQFEAEQLRKKQEAEKKYRERVDEIIMESYDHFNKHENDKFDPKTGVKMSGFSCPEKFEEYHDCMDRVLKRRLERRKQ